MNRQAVSRIIRRSTQSMRLNRINAFLQIMRPSSHETILEVGGEPQQWLQCGYRGTIVFLNLYDSKDFQHIAPNFHYLQGDGRCLDLPDNSFDIVFSNSVIEHVGALAEQKQFANETSRVGKRYWIQTPNKYFPIEPHFNFPLMQFLPLRLRVTIAESWPLFYPPSLDYNEAANMEDIVRSIRLMTIADMRALYPNGTIWKERLCGLVKSIVAYRC